MAVVSMRALLETGVHFGHRTRRWNPKMKPYIFTERNGIHILDLQQTIIKLHELYELVRNTVADGGTIMFVGTKRQAQAPIEAEAIRCGMPYVNQRWLGGTLTNWKTIRQRINHLDTLEKKRDSGEFDGLKKREQLSHERTITKLNSRLGGIRKMNNIPDLVFIVDINTEETAVREANRKNVPIIAMVDSNCNPDVVDHILPSNDDAIRAIKLIVGIMADAALEGQNMREATSTDDAVSNYDNYSYPGKPEGDLHDAGDDALLGTSTLAKIKADGEAAAKAAAEAAAKAAEAAAVEKLAAEAVEAVVVDEPAVEAPAEVKKEDSAE